MARFHFAATADSDMFYSMGGSICDSFFLVEKDGKRTIFLNVLEIDAFKERNSHIEALAIEPFQKKSLTLHPERGSAMGKLAYVILKDFDLLGSTIEVSRRFPLDVADYLRLQGVTLHIKTPFMPERSRKSAEEIGYIRSAQETTGRAFTLIENILRNSGIVNDSIIYKREILTGEFLKREAGSFLYTNGMDDPEGMIISSGRQAAMPHHKGKGLILPHQTIVCDIFPRSRESGYFADMTRTYAKGIPSPQAIKMYEAVKNAQDKALDLVKPGASAKDIHNAAAKVIKSAGFDVGKKGFIHSLGHGLGLDVHEAPSISSSSIDILEVGNVITIEPGLYYPEYGGVRLEDVVVVTENGFENLTNYPRNFTI